MSDTRTTIPDLFTQIPNAIWSPAAPFPLVYRGTPVEMVQQMANEMGPGVTVSQAMNTLLEALAKEGRLRIQITGDPPEEVLAGIFVFSLLRHGVLHPMAQA